MSSFSSCSGRQEQHFLQQRYSIGSSVFLSKKSSCFFMLSRISFVTTKDINSKKIFKDVTEWQVKRPTIMIYKIRWVRHFCLTVCR